MPSLLSFRLSPSCTPTSLPSQFIPRLRQMFMQRWIVLLARTDSLHLKTVTNSHMSMQYAKRLFPCLNQYHVQTKTPSWHIQLLHWLPIVPLVGRISILTCDALRQSPYVQDIPHRATRDATYKGYSIPEGSWVWYIPFELSELN